MWHLNPHSLIEVEFIDECRIKLSENSHEILICGGYWFCHKCNVEAPAGIYVLPLIAILWTNSISFDLSQSISHSRERIKNVLELGNFCTFFANSFPTVKRTLLEDNGHLQHPYLETKLEIACYNSLLKLLVESI
jgi:hypothetical protein